MMQKTLRILALFTALVLFCLSATGCNAIDEMRAHHGLYAENHNVIMVGKTQYRLLPDNRYLAPSNAAPDPIYVTDKDVPVLLSSRLGVAFCSYNDGLLLHTGAYRESRYYCRADKYDELVVRLEEEFNPTGYCYRYSVYNEETYDYEEHTYRLTKEQEAVIRDIIANDIGVIRDTRERYNNDDHIMLYACSDDMLLQDYEITIEKKYGYYYHLVEYDDITNMDIAYTVPYDKYTVFNAIFKSKFDAQKAEDNYYNDLYDYDYDYDAI